jgi:hypothetical protein
MNSPRHSLWLANASSIDDEEANVSSVEVYLCAVDARSGHTSSSSFLDSDSECRRSWRYARDTLLVFVMVAAALAVACVVIAT